MASNIVFWAASAQVLLQTCLGASFQKRPEDDLETFYTDILPLSDLPDEQQPTQVSEESDGWDEWDDYEEEPANKCNLTSFELNQKASYICQDGTAWSVDIQETGDEKCIYSRNVKSPSGENEFKKTYVNCHVAQEWLEDLLQYEVISGIPDMFLFKSKNSDNKNTDNGPTVHESFPAPVSCNK